ncbi:glutathione S-transferase T3-like [Lactuca sativa]|uniref:glutathione S-transferase T3-like n=1 Tax=Lactuca sativa TaxID=4236 RepID=UPI0022AF6487|nr:glutathione S-transferase T3-like [Lactuca sativa]
MRQTVTQPTPTQEPVVETQAGGSKRASGKKGRPKKKGKEVVVGTDETETPPTWWTPEEEHALATAWCGTSKQPTMGNDMKRVAFWDAVIVKFRTILNKGDTYRNNDMLRGKWTQISRKCTKFNSIYNKLSSQRQSGANDFDVFRVAMEEYHVQMGHVFKYEKVWELVRKDPKWMKTPTSSEQQSKRSRGSGSVDVSDGRTNIDLNADTDEIQDKFDDIEEISPPRRPMGREKAKRAQRHAEKNESRLREHEEMKKKIRRPHGNRK